MIVVFLVVSPFLLFSASTYCQPSWPTPTSWIQIDSDKNENGLADDWRDVEYAYYQYDSDYLYLKLKCYDIIGKGWPDGKGRYKWFVDFEGNMYHSGGSIYDAEYLVFVEDTDNDGFGEMYLVFDTNGDNTFGEYEPWPPANNASYQVTDPSVGGWRIDAQHQIEMYINWASIGNPPSYWLTWATDQENPNLDQGPTTDHVDEEQPIAVHDIAAISQTPTPTSVTQGDPVTVEVVVENQGTQTETFNVTCYFDSGVVGTLPVSNLPAGCNTTLIFNWDTTGEPLGTYTITAWADSSAAIAETDETDNWCNALATVTIQPAPVHDVAATSQVPNVTEVEQGDPVEIEVTVENLGNFAETFNVACYYDGSEIGTQTVTNLQPSSSTTVSFIWNTAGVLPSFYYIKAMADSGRVITEVDENNNNCTSFTSVTVYIPGEPGELFVDKATTAVISGHDPPVVGFATVYELTVTVTNIGGSDVEDIMVEDTISSDVTYVSVGTPSQGSVTATPPPKIVWNVGTLTPAASATLTFRVSIAPTTSGLFYLNHKEDLLASGNDTYTSNPVSDTGNTDLTVNALVRDVAAISQAPSSTTINRGETVAIDVTVQNLGDQSESFNVTCYYDSTPIGTLRVNNLSPSSSEILTFAWDTTGVATGIYSINAKADSSNEIDESDENNNECPVPASVKIVVHDIATTSQTPTPTTVTEGETVTIQVIVENQGTEPETFTVTCCYDSFEIGTQTVTNLQPSSSTTVTFIWHTTGIAAGTYYITAVASPVPGEKDTNDNSCTSITMVTVTAPSPPSPSVGGYALPIKLDLGTSNSLFSQIGLASALSATVAAALILVRRRKKK